MAGWDADAMNRIHVVIAMLAVFLGVGLGSRDILSKREGRVAACAQEMLRGGDWWTPRIGGEARTRKPPLPYWASAASGLLLFKGDLTETAVRFPSFLAAWGTLILTFLIGSHAGLSARASLLSSAVLATSWLFWNESRTAAADMPMTLFSTLALYLWLSQVASKGRWLWRSILPWMALAGAFLAKGPVGILVPLAVMALDLGVQRQWKRLPCLLPSLPALGVFLMLTLPWFISMNAQQPGASGQWWYETAGRFQSEGIDHYHPNPLYYFLGKLEGAFAPWIILLPWLAWEWRRRRASDRPTPPRLAWTWPVAALTIFSMSLSKREYYLLPVLPGLSLGVGWLLDEGLSGFLAWKSQRVKSLLRMTFLALSTAYLGLGLFILPNREAEKSPRHLSQLTAAGLPEDPVPREIHIPNPDDIPQWAFYLGRLNIAIQSDQDRILAYRIPASPVTKESP
ncbi:MAG: ArnT family glycosyltransferase [Planctomycetota bacterium]